MFKKVFAAAVVLTGLAAPALADDMAMTKCTEANIMKAEKEAKMMKGDKMTMAMKDVDMAKTAMKAHNDKDCSMALDKAMKASM